MRNKRKSLTAALAAITILVGVSCKDNTLLSPYVPEDSGKFSYDINGLRDTSLERTDDVRYLIYVEKLAGKSESVILSADELPTGMEVVFDPANGVEAPFNTTMVIKNVRVKEGEHRIKIKGAAPTAGIKSKYITVTVLPYSNAAVGLKGVFTESGQCSQSGNLNNNVNIVVDESAKNKIELKGLFSSVMSNVIKADINPDKKTLTIPSQKVNSVTYEGDGTFDDDKLIINYTVTGLTINESCTATLTRN